MHLSTARRTLLSMALAAACGLAQAQAYPGRLIRIVCAHAPGGAADQLSRILSERLAGVLGQAVIVENRPGASTMLAAEYVAAQPADGYTLLMATVTTLSINPSLHTKLRYDPVKDFAPVSIVASTPFFLGVNPALPAKSVADVVALARRKPGELNYGSSGNGTSSHLAGELFNDMAGIKTTHVPYKATSTRNTDLASGAIQMVFGNDVMPLAKGGKVRIVGVTSERRLSGFPDIPTVAESAGLAGYEASVWYGLVAPAGTPAPVIERLNTAIVKILAQPEVKEQVMAVLGGDTVGNTPQAFSERIKGDLQKWGAVIRRSNVKSDE